MCGVHSSVIFSHSDFFTLKSIKVTSWDQSEVPLFQSTIIFICTWFYYSWANTRANYENSQDTIQNQKQKHENQLPVHEMHNSVGKSLNGLE